MGLFETTSWAVFIGLLVFYVAVCAVAVHFIVKFW